MQVADARSMTPVAWRAQTPAPPHRRRSGAVQLRSLRRAGPAAAAAAWAPGRNRRRRSIGEPHSGNRAPVEPVGSGRRRRAFGDGGRPILLAELAPGSGRPWRRGPAGRTRSDSRTRPRRAPPSAILQHVVIAQRAAVLAAAQQLGEGGHAGREARVLRRLLEARGLRARGRSASRSAGSTSDFGSL